MKGSLLYTSINQHIKYLTSCSGKKLLEWCCSLCMFHDELGNDYRKDTWTLLWYEQISLGIHTLESFYLYDSMNTHEAREQWFRNKELPTNIIKMPNKLPRKACSFPSHPPILGLNHQTHRTSGVAYHHHHNMKFHDE